MIETLEHGRVHEIRLARPPVNALDSAMLAALIDALRSVCARNPGAIVLSGQPGMFSAGLDVPRLLGYSRQQMLEFWSHFFGAQQALAACAVPVAAALTGHSPAGGAVLALQCDYRVMAEGKYRIGLNEVQVGLFPGPTIYAAFKRLVGTRNADRLMSGGVMLSPPEALAAGLVDRVVPEGEVIGAALEWAQHMASLPPRALALTRRMARADLVALTASLGAADYEAMNEAWYSEETQATMRKLVDKLRKSQ